MTDTPQQPCVFILLSTYNGAAFLRAQLDSFTQQTHANWVLHWRDDGSRDATRPLLAGFAQENIPSRCIELADNRGNLGPAASFLALLSAVSDQMLPTDLVAFADQDDVWLPEKLARAVTAVAHGPSGHPTLYAARQTLVDGDLREIGPSPRQTPPAGFAASLIQNLAAGCTIVMNQAAARLVASSRPAPETLHDWWSYMLVLGAGGRFVQDDSQVILYRQHGGNAVGAPSGMLRRGLAAARRGPGRFMALLRAHVAALRAQPELLTEAARHDLDVLDAALRSSWWQRLRALFLPGLRRQTALETLIFRIWFMLG